MSFVSENQSELRFFWYLYDNQRKAMKIRFKTRQSAENWKNNEIRLKEIVKILTIRVYSILS